MYAFAPGGGLVYNHDDNWQWFGGVYKGFNLPGPSSARDDGSPVEKETSIAKEIGVRYSSPTFFMSWTGFHTDFKDLIVIDNSNTDSAPDNAGNVVSKGFELSSTYAPENFKPFGGDISFFANYTFTNANLDGAATSTDQNQLLLVVGMVLMYHTYQTIVYHSVLIMSTMTLILELI